MSVPVIATLAIAGAAMYVACWRWAFRRSIAAARRNYPRIPIDGSDIAQAVVVASVVAVAAPVLLAGLAARPFRGMTPEQVADAIGGEPRARRRERRIRELEATNARLERALGIGDDR